MTNKSRARDLGIPLDGVPGTCNAITDNDKMDALFEAVIQATEEAILNALVAAETMTGIDDRMVFALSHNQLQQILRKYNRLALP